MNILDCPDCGTFVKVTQGRRWTAECPEGQARNNCRASGFGIGRTADSARRDFQDVCRRAGHTAWADERKRQREEARKA